MEFGASEDQPELDRLINSEQYDEMEARRLMFNYNVKWAYKEYADIYKAAWKLNKSLPMDARKFRILNLSYIYNWDGFSGMRTPKTLKRYFTKEISRLSEQISWKEKLCPRVIKFLY